MFTPFDNNAENKAAEALPGKVLRDQQSFCEKIEPPTVPLFHRTIGGCYFTCWCYFTTGLILPVNLESVQFIFS